MKVFWSNGYHGTPLLWRLPTSSSSPKTAAVPGAAAEGRVMLHRTWPGVFAFPAVVLAVSTVLLLSACTAVPIEPPYKVTKAYFQKAANHEYDGIYKGRATQALGAICGAGYVPAQWFAMMDVTEDRFHLTTYLNGPERRGNASPGGVLTRYKVFVGRIVDRRFQGAIDIGDGCRATFVL